MMRTLNVVLFISSSSLSSSSAETLLTTNISIILSKHNHTLTPCSPLYELIYQTILFCCHRSARRVNCVRVCPTKISGIKQQPGVPQFTRDVPSLELQRVQNQTTG